MKPRILLVGALLMATLGAVLPARAATFSVTSTADNGTGTLRDALALANAKVDADTITFNLPAGAQTITLSSGLLDIYNDVSIIGPGAGALKVDGNRAINNSVFRVSGSGVTASMAGLTITGGTGNPARLEVDSATGGGVNNLNANLTLSNCAIVGNSAKYGGGGVANSGGTVTINNCTVSGNSAGNGGGIISGGFSFSTGTLIVQNSIISNNTNGGVVAGRMATLTNCTISGNTGGSGISSGGTFSLSNCTVSNNSNSNGFGGGGLTNNGGTATVQSCTFAGNTSTSMGSSDIIGGIYNNLSATLVVSNTILNNTGGNLANRDTSATITDEGYNLANDGGNGFLTASTDKLNTDPKLGPLQLNGGSTPTQALLPGSPAIDAGNSTLPTDGRGGARPLDDPKVANADGGNGSDIGSFEAVPDRVQSGASLVVNQTDDHDDGECSVNDCTLREAIHFAPSGAAVTFDARVFGTPQTIALQSSLPIGQSVSVNGPGAGQLIISHQALTVSAGRVTIKGLTIENGSGIYNTGGTVALSSCVLLNNSIGAIVGDVAHGGAINNKSAMTLSNCRLSNNQAEIDALNSIRGQGGAIYNTGTMALSNCTLSGNVAQGAGVGRGGRGGAIYNTGTMKISACTLSGNGTTNSGSQGGAIYNSGTATLFNSTVTGNSAEEGGAGFYNEKGAITLASCTVMGNGPGPSSHFELHPRATFNISNTILGDSLNASGATINDGGTNLTRDGSLSGPTDKTASDFKLGPLQFNGGPTQTFALLFASPAINAGATSLSTDQRGQKRDSKRDIGAFEFVNRAPGVSVSPSDATDKVGAKRTFVLTASDPDGAGDITEMSLLINESLDLSSGALLRFDVRSGLLFLKRGDAFLPAIRIGAAAKASDVADNGAVRVVGSEVSVASSPDGSSLSLSVPATIRDGLVGKNILFGRVVDASDVASSSQQGGFVRLGTYVVESQFMGATNTIPTLLGLSPRVANTTLAASGVGTAQNFVVSFRDENGASDLDSLIFLAGPKRTGANSASFVFFPRTRRLFLRSDDGRTLLGGGQIGTSGVLENSQVRLDLSKVQLLVAPDGKSLGLRLPLQAKVGLLGQNRVWLRVQDRSGALASGGDREGFIPSGTWNVSATPTPSASPSMGAS